MVKRVLVTTALEETWPKNDPVLFLGEWCRLHIRKKRWTAMDAEVLPYHWDDRKKLLADYNELQSFYERVLPDVAAQLNQIHGVNHGVRYWRVLIGPWLNCFIQVLFDRWTTIQQAVSQYEISGALILAFSQASCVPNDMANYTDIVLNDAGNEHIYATILQQFTNVRCTVVEQKEESKAVPTERRSKRGLKSLLIDAYIWGANVISRNTDVVLFMADMPFANAKKLLMRLHQVPQLRYAPTLEQVGADPTQRQWRVNGDDRSDFEAAARTLIPQFIPTTYLEGYEKLLEKVRGMPWPSRPKLIYTTTGQYTVDVFKAWAAEKTEYGTKLVIGQHGGQYGIGLWVIHEDHETAIADTFLSWGWSDPKHPEIKPIGLLKAVRPLGVHHASQPNALLVVASLPRYSYWLRSITIASQWLDYFEDQCAFVEHLPKHIQDALIVRLHHKDYDWDQEGRWGDRFPQLSLDPCKTDMNALIAKSRIFITTYNATTYLESFAMNVPTVIYWNPKLWELRDSAVPYFEGLKRVGIFHETPLSAATHVTAIWDDVDAWWTSAEVRDEVARFSHQYGRHSETQLKDIELSLREALEPGMNCDD